MLSCKVSSTHLLPCKHILVKVKLELFIGNVDAELFKRIILAVLKAENIEHANTMQPLTIRK